MNKYIFIFLCLLKLSSFASAFLYYRPMSKKSIDFGEDVCYYEDISDDSNLKYVKGCPSGKRCLPVLTDISEYHLHTCQPYFSGLKRQIGENCDANLYECANGYDCTNGKCSNGSGSGGTSPPCTTIGKKINTGTEECITDQSQISAIGDVCETKDSFSSTDKIYYTHYSITSNLCNKLQIRPVEGSTQEKYYIKTKELVKGYFSLQDGDYFEDPIDEKYCENGFYLYFFGNGKQKLDTSDEQMYKRCVKVLAIEEISAGTSYVIKYKINNEEHIYDTSKLNGDYNTNINGKCSASLMTKLELFQKMKEEYRKNPNSNEYIKWEYLYGKPEEYLLYKDQIEVLDYLIQKSKLTYIPEGLTPNANGDNIQTATTDGSETPGTEAPTEPNNQSSGFLNIHYFIILLSLFIL